MRIKFTVALTLACLVTTHCTKREWDNPFDGSSNLKPEDWAPNDFRIDEISTTSRKLTWTYGEHNIEGFKLDRKKGEDQWQTCYKTFSKETREWVDEDIIPDPTLQYSYRLYAYAGNFTSSEKHITLIGSIPAPTNLHLEKLSDISYRLTWQDNSTGEEGYKIDRKTTGNDWVIGYGVVGPNLSTFVDTNVFIGKSSIDVEYRVYAFYKEFESAKIATNTNAALTAPSNLYIAKNSITSITLYWLDNSKGEEGFKIERKHEGGAWQQVAITTTNSWQDNGFDLNTQVYYRVCAYIGQHLSDYAESNFDSQIPPPASLQIGATSSTSVTLSWSYTTTGHEGFKIDRKVGNGSWTEGFATLNTGQTSYQDNGVDLGAQNYTYWVYSFYNQSISEKSEISSHSLCGYSITDSRDNNNYETVKIGNQCWMKENLKYLPNVSPSANGSNTSAYHYVYGYQGTSVSEAKGTSNYQTYGVLYNWTAAMTACPEGWHLPTDSEWDVLINYLGGSSVAGGKMKTTGTTHWNFPNLGATNESGFSGLPGGHRTTSNGYFLFIGNYGYWWSSTESSSANAWVRDLDYQNLNATRYSTNKERGYSVRCLRD